MKKTTKLEAVIWSVAFPGFGQLLNGQPSKRNDFYPFRIHHKCKQFI